MLTWNVANQTRQKQMPPVIASAIASLTPDIIVLTEYVPGESRAAFLAELTEQGLVHQCVSPFMPKQNHVLIASRTPLIEGNIRPPDDIKPAVPSNVLHVLSPANGLEVLGVRVLDFKKPLNKRRFWDWIEETAASAKNRPFVILGDFNTCREYSPARCGNRIGQLIENGWQYAAPRHENSWWGPNGSSSQIDHAFVTEHFAVLNAQYVVENAGYIFAGKETKGFSDHAVLVFEITKTL